MTDRTPSWLDLLSCPPDQLHSTQAVQLVERLGDLGTWCLQPPVIEKAAARFERVGQPALAAGLRSRPELPQQRGACWFVVAQNPEHPRPALSPAFVWPLCWKPAEDHAPQLPPSFRDVADDVLRVLRQIGGVKPGSDRADVLPLERWKLHFVGDEPSLLPDFRNLPLNISAESGWTSLAVGLLAAITGGTVNRHVWSSACWEGGIQGVSQLEAKLALADDRDCRKFFVAASQSEDARRWVAANSSTMQIGELKTDEARPLTALDTYLDAFNIPPERVPDDEQNFRRRCLYYESHPSHPAAREFFLSNLLPDLADRQIRRPLARQWPGWQPEVLVASISMGTELILLLAAALQPAKCLLYHTADRLSEAEKTAKELIDMGCPAPLLPFTDLNDVADRLTTELTHALEGHDPDRVLLDLTTGSKLMTLEIERTARPGHRLIYLQNEHGLQRQPPESIEPRVARVCAEGDRPHLQRLPVKPD